MKTEWCYSEGNTPMESNPEIVPANVWQPNSGASTKLSTAHKGAATATTPDGKFLLNYASGYHYRKRNNKNSNRHPYFKIIKTCLDNVFGYVNRAIQSIGLRKKCQFLRLNN